jgi:small subunit ribosomal protein S17
MESKEKSENSGSGKSPILSKKKGVVVSDKMKKTIIVAVNMFKAHPKYRKKYKVTRRYKVHDEENRYKVGDVVEIIPCRPMSKDKAYKVVY